MHVTRSLWARTCVVEPLNDEKSVLCLFEGEMKHSTQLVQHLSLGRIMPSGTVAHDEYTCLFVDIWLGC